MSGLKLHDLVRVNKDGSAYNGRVGYIVRPGRRPGFWHVQFPMQPGEPDRIRRNYAEKDLVKVLTDEEAGAVLRQHICLVIDRMEDHDLLNTMGQRDVLVDALVAAVADAAAEVKGS